MIINGTRGELEEKAARLMGEAVDSVLKQKDSVVIGVVGGSSVANVFAHLGGKNLPWEKIHLFMVDERMVPLEHEDSNFGLALPYFRDIFPEENLHPFVFTEGKEGEALTAYKSELESHGGRYDMVLLSSGEDGHIAALFPGHHSIKSDEPFFTTMADSPKTPPARMTASRGLISRSGLGILLVFGEGKKQAFTNFKNTGLTVQECPAKIVCDITEHYILTDLEVTP